jgi:hypothetical protein
MTVGALAPALVLMGTLPVHADPATGDVPDSAPVLGRPDAAAGRHFAASSDVDEPGAYLAEAAGSDRITLDEQTRPVAPGLELRSFRWLDSAGFMQGDVLTAQLGTKGLRLDYVDAGSVTSAAPVEQQIEDAGAVAGANDDFFDINSPGPPASRPTAPSPPTRSRVDKSPLLGDRWADRPRQRTAARAPDAFVQRPAG